MLSGSCICGGVAFEIANPPKHGSVCHCSQCRKQSCHLWASAVVGVGDLALTRDETLKWYRASDSAKRGFCGTCGAFLFWKHTADTTISFALGALESPTGISLSRHIFVADKGDFYDITDTLDQSAR